MLLENKNNAKSNAQIETNTNKIHTHTYIHKMVARAAGDDCVKRLAFNLKMWPLFKTRKERGTACVREGERDSACACYCACACDCACVSISGNITYYRRGN